MRNQNFVYDHGQFYSTLLPQIQQNLFIILKIRSHAKYLHFCELNMRTQGSYPLLNKKFKDFKGLHSMPKKPLVHFFFSSSTTSNFILMVFLCLLLLVLENPGWIKLALKFKDFPAPTASFKDFQRLSRCVRALKTRKCLRVVSLSLLS